MTLDRTTQHILHLSACAERVSESLTAANLAGADDAVVLLLDACDPHARAIAEAYNPEDQLDALIAMSQGEGARAFVTISMGSSPAAALLATDFGDIAEKISTPSGRKAFWAVIVAEDSATAVLVPLIRECPPPDDLGLPRDRPGPERKPRRRRSTRARPPRR